MKRILARVRCRETPDDIFYVTDDGSARLKIEQTFDGDGTHLFLLNKETAREVGSAMVRWADEQEEK